MKILKALVLALMALLILTRSEGFASAEWVEVDASGNIPEGSIVAGCNDGSSRDRCTTPLYVCRGMIEDALFTGKTGQGWGFCNVEWGGQEHQVTPQYVLQGRVTTVPLLAEKIRVTHWFCWFYIISSMEST